MTPAAKYLAEVRKLLEAATPGKWEWDGSYINATESCTSVVAGIYSYPLAISDADASLIAAAPEALAKLVAVAEAALELSQGYHLIHATPERRAAGARLREALAALGEGGE
jgi:hypothetical protein